MRIKINFSTPKVYERHLFQIFLLKIHQANGDLGGRFKALGARGVSPYSGF